MVESRLFFKISQNTFDRPAPGLAPGTELRNEFPIIDGLSPETARAHLSLAQMRLDALQKHSQSPNHVRALFHSISYLYRVFLMGMGE